MPESSLPAYRSRYRFAALYGKCRRDGTAGVLPRSGRAPGAVGSRTEYIAPFQDFIRWWDGTLGAGEDIEGGFALPSGSADPLLGHLNMLRQAGFALTVDTFQDRGYQGAGTSSAAGWFTFTAHGQLPVGGSGNTAGKGAVNCATGLLRAIVLD